MYNRRLSMLALSLLVIWGGSRTYAQAAPQPLPLSLIGSTELSPDQVNQIKTYVKYHADRLNTSTEWADVEAARGALITPLNQPNPARMVSPVFRLEYSMVATPEMQAAVKDESLHRVTNAMLVLAQLGDDRAATALLAYADPQQQPRWQVRLRAADGLKVMFQSGVLDARHAPQLAAKVRDAAMKEGNGLVLTNLLAALDAAIGTVQPVDAPRVRQYLIEAMVSLATRIEKSQDLAILMLDAFTKELERFREKYVALSLADSAALGATLGPALGRVLAHIVASWDEAQADPKMIEKIAVVVGACETSLQFIDVRVRKDPAPPWDGNLRSAWSAGNKAEFERGVMSWQGVLSKPPYKPS